MISSADVLGLLHSDLIERRVSAATQLAPGLPPVLGDRVQLQQVLLNLILNACDAMADREPGDRLLTIATSAYPRGLVQLSVSDEGIGISEARLEQIFEPFVSTKENGLGLGLAISRSIITAHGGRLWAVNNVGRGATFFLELDPTDPESTTPMHAGGEDGSGRQPAQPCRYPVTDSSTSSRRYSSKGFSRYATAPALSARRRATGSSMAVTKTMGTALCLLPTAGTEAPARSSLPGADRARCSRSELRSGDTPRLRRRSRCGIPRDEPAAPSPSGRRRRHPRWPRAVTRAGSRQATGMNRSRLTFALSPCTGSHADGQSH